MKMTSNPGVNLLSGLWSFLMVNKRLQHNLQRGIPICEIVSNRAAVHDRVWTSRWLKEEEDRCCLKAELQNVSSQSSYEGKKLTDWNVAFPSVKSRVP